MRLRKASLKRGVSIQRNSLAIFALAFVFAFVLWPAVTQADPWAQHKDRLPALAHKLQENESAIRHLLAEKKHVDDPAQVHEIMRELIEKHKALAQASKEYEDERLHVRFKHPDLASVVERRYKRYQLKSIEELGNVSGLDGRLDQLKAKVTAVFPLPNADKGTKDENDRVPASTAEVEDLKFEPVILTK